MDFSVPADHRIKLKESEKKDKYLDLARELKKLWNMKVTIIPIVIGAFGTVTKGLIKGLEDLEVEGRVETIIENWEESCRFEEICCHSNSSERPSAKTDVKNSQGLNDNYNIRQVVVIVVVVACWTIVIKTEKMKKCIQVFEKQKAWRKWPGKR